MIVVIIIINFVFRGPLGRILHSNRCHPLKIKVIIIKDEKIVKNQDGGLKVPLFDLYQCHV